MKKTLRYLALGALPFLVSSQAKAVETGIDVGLDIGKEDFGLKKLEDYLGIHIKAGQISLEELEALTNNYLRNSIERRILINMNIELLNKLEKEEENLRYSILLAAAASAISGAYSIYQTLRKKTKS